MVSSIPGPYPLDAHSIPPLAVTTKNVSRPPLWTNSEPLCQVLRSGSSTWAAVVSFPLSRLLTCPGVGESAFGMYRRQLGEGAHCIAVFTAGTLLRALSLQCMGTAPSAFTRQMLPVLTILPALCF